MANAEEGAVAWDVLLGEERLALACTHAVEEHILLYLRRTFAAAAARVVMRAKRRVTTGTTSTAT